ncbi:TPA: TnpV protein [Streptococcus suis]|nr:TnpV protein [Streptococcus suis]HEL2580957.1 TnpV protein [Streptococcus suis]
MSELKPRIKENGIDYILVGDYYIPDLKLPEEHRPIGKYGRMHREYLREVCPARLHTLTLTEELKRTRQMEWVQRCNNIHNRAEEIVLHEMIYS